MSSSYCFSISIVQRCVSNECAETTLFKYHFIIPSVCFFFVCLVSSFFLVFVITIHILIVPSVYMFQFLVCFCFIIILFHFIFVVASCYNKCSLFHLSVCQPGHLNIWNVFKCIHSVFIKCRTFCYTFFCCFCICSTCHTIGKARNGNKSRKKLLVILIWSFHCCTLAHYTK